MIITEKQLLLLFDLSLNVLAFMQGSQLQLSLDEKTLRNLINQIYDQQSNKLIEVK